MNNRARWIVSRLFDLFLIIGIIYLSYHVFAPSMSIPPMDLSGQANPAPAPQIIPETIIESNPLESEKVPVPAVVTPGKIPESPPIIIKEPENSDSPPFHEEMIKDIEQSLPDYDNPSSISSMENRIHELVNIERQKNGLGSLDYDKQLSDIARAYSLDMARRNFFDHFSPEGESFSARYEKAGYECRIVTRIEGNIEHFSKGGENLLKTTIIKTSYYVMGEYQYSETKTLEEIASGGVKGWMESPSHRENILTSHWRKEGIGVGFSEDGTVYITENFC